MTSQEWETIKIGDRVRVQFGPAGWTKATVTGKHENELGMKGILVEMFCFGRMEQDVFFDIQSVRLINFPVTTSNREKGRI